MKQLTVRGFDDELSERIRREAEQEGISLSKAALRLLRRGAGLPTAPKPSLVKKTDSPFDFIIGSMTKDEADEIDKIIEESFEVIDENAGIAPDTLSRLARLPVEERRRVLLGASILVDADETEAWDSTLNDGLD